MTSNSNQFEQNKLSECLEQIVCITLSHFGISVMGQDVLTGRNTGIAITKGQFCSILSQICDILH